jgi:acetyl esterase/lipase
MDKIRQTIADYGSSWSKDIVPHLTSLYDPLQAVANAHHSSTVKVEKALKYGPDPRQRLDVYYPSAVTPGAPTPSPLPVVVYIHGGAYVAGDTEATPNIYANIGNYFASRDHITVLATYRLVYQGAKWPSGAEDVRDALRWVQSTVHRYGGDKDRVVVMGQSAGGGHVATALFLGLLSAEQNGGEPLVRGTVLLSAALGSDHHPRTQMFDIMKAYYGTGDSYEMAGRFSPAALFRSEFFGGAEREPRRELGCEVLVLWAEWEIEEIMGGNLEFFGDYRRRFGRLPRVEVMRGQNHVSYCLGLGLEGEEYERVGRRLVEFVREVTSG